MSEKNFNIYLEFSYSKLNIAAFDKLDGKLKYYKQKSYKTYFKNEKELNFNELEKIVEENILEIEKSTREFVKDIYLMVETPQSKSIKLSVMKNNEGNQATTQDAMYLIQDAKQQLLKSNLNIGIIHIIVEKYVLDNTSYNFLPLNVECRKFSIDIQFICFPKNLKRNFKKLFLKQEILINRLICSNYVKLFNLKNEEENSCKLGKEIIEGINKREVVSIPKTIKKKGFFEKLFHFFK